MCQRWKSGVRVVQRPDPCPSLSHARFGGCWKDQTALQALPQAGRRTVPQAGRRTVPQAGRRTVPGILDSGSQDCQMSKSGGEGAASEGE